MVIIKLNQTIVVDFHFWNLFDLHKYIYFSISFKVVKINDLTHQTPFFLQTFKFFWFQNLLPELIPYNESMYR